MKTFKYKFDKLSGVGTVLISGVTRELADKIMGDGLGLPVLSVEEEGEEDQSALDKLIGDGIVGPVNL